MKYWALSFIDTLDNYENLKELKAKHCYQCSYSKVIFSLIYTNDSNTHLRHVNICENHSNVINKLGNEWEGEVVSLDYLLRYAKVHNMKMNF